MMDESYGLVEVAVSKVSLICGITEWKIIVEIILGIKIKICYLDPQQKHNVFTAYIYCVFFYNLYQQV